MYTLTDQVVIVTGGANGIGANIVKECLQEGVKVLFIANHKKFVAIIDVDEQSGAKLEKYLVTEYGKEKAKFFKCDVTRDDDLYDIFNRIVKDQGAIDFLINNAAILTETMKTFKKEIAINFTATVASTLKALELMRTDHGGKGGTIINIISIGALLLVSPGFFVYSATKSAILHFDCSIGKEDYYRHTNVRVFTVCFGLTDTNIFDKLESFDDRITEGIKNMMTTLKPKTFQSPKVAAQGLLQSYKRGKSGSTWLVDSNKVTDITDNIYEAFKIMATNVHSVNDG